MIKVSIIGVTGYAGIELLHLLKAHPQVEIKHLISHSQAGKLLDSVYPQFSGIEDIILEEYDLNLLQDSDLVFTALPHGVAQDIVAELFTAGIKVVDLSGDYRYEKPEIYEEWYNIEHKHPELLAKSVYGLVEINRADIKNANLVANPGCYPTASLLGLLPIIKKKFIDINSIIIDAKSGVSGAGRSLSLTTHFTEADESIKAYKVAGHRHVSEIESILAAFANKNLILSFTPHLIPMKRGILSTIYINLKEIISDKKLFDIYQDFYTGSQFVQVLSGDIVPETKYVAGTNYCHLGLTIDTRLKRLIVISAIDNLGKGAAGQAVQNMNLMFSLPEVTGLEGTAIFP